MRLLVVFPDIDKVMIVGEDEMDDRRQASLYSISGTGIGDDETVPVKYRTGSKPWKVVQTAMEALGLNPDERKTIIELND